MNQAKSSGPKGNKKALVSRCGCAENRVVTNTFHETFEVIGTCHTKFETITAHKTCVNTIACKTTDIDKITNKNVCFTVLEETKKC